MNNESIRASLLKQFTEFRDGLSDQNEEAAINARLWSPPDSLPPVPDRIHWLLSDGEPHPVQEIAQEQFGGRLYQVGLEVLRHRGHTIIPSYSEERFFYQIKTADDQGNDGLNKDQLVTSAEFLFAMDAARGIDAADPVLRVLPEYLDLDPSQFRSLAYDRIDYRDEMFWEDGIAIIDGRAMSIDVDPDLHEEGVGDQGLS